MDDITLYCECGHTFAWDNRTGTCDFFSDESASGRPYHESYYAMNCPKCGENCSHFEHESYDYDQDEE